MESSAHPSTSTPTPGTSPPSWRRTYDDDGGGTSEARRIFEVIDEEGRLELERPLESLFWSGLTAGALMSLSLVMTTVIRATLGTEDAAPLVSALGYPAGFLLVMLGHMQLFTENTITTVLPVLEQRTFAFVKRSALLWAIVLGANVIGAAAVAAAWVFGMLPAHYLPDLVAVSRANTAGTFGEVFLHAIPAGFIIAVLVWVTRLARQRVLLILLFTWLIGAAHFRHVVVGTVEWFVLVWTEGQEALSLGWTFFLPALLGNVVGGTLIFALLAWAQVREESASGSPAAESDSAKTTRPGRRPGVGVHATTH